jgi:hypothetical protein
MAPLTNLMGARQYMAAGSTCQQAVHDSRQYMTAGSTWQQAVMTIGSIRQQAPVNTEGPNLASSQPTHGMPCHAVLCHKGSCACRPGETLRIVDLMAA